MNEGDRDRTGQGRSAEQPNAQGYGLPGHRVHGVEVSWESARELFSLDPAVAHLNHGSFGAVPIPVQLAQQRLRDEMDADPVAFFTRGLSERIAHTRRHVATFLGADCDGAAFVPNVTAGVQIVLNSMDLKPGDEVLLTDHVYGAVGLAVAHGCARAGATVNEVSIPLRANDDDIVARVAAAVRPATRLAIIDHITSSTARLFPVARIVAALRSHGVPVLIDAAHAPGMLAVDVSAPGADFWVGNLHKWAFAPRPTALLVVAQAYRHRIEPLVVSWHQPDGFPQSIESGGTLDYTAWLAATTGIHLLRTLGADRVRRHNADLAAHGQRTVAAALGVDQAALAEPGGARSEVARPEVARPEVARPEAARPEAGGSAGLSMRLVPLPAGVAGSPGAAERLRQRIADDLACQVAIFAWHGRGYLRLSAQIYNRPEDYDRLAAALPRLVREAAAESPR